MIIYNVTVKIEKSIAEEWLTWMQTEHIPQVMLTECFMEYHIFKVLIEEEDGITYSVQYLCSDMEVYEKYRDEFAPTLQAETQKKYKDRFFAFRTLLEVIA